MSQLMSHRSRFVTSVLLPMLLMVYEVVKQWGEGGVKVCSTETAFALSATRACDGSSSDATPLTPSFGALLPAGYVQTPNPASLRPRPAQPTRALLRSGDEQALALAGDSGRDVDGLLRCVRVRVALEDLEVQPDVAAQAALGQHALHRVLDDALRQALSRVACVACGACGACDGEASPASGRA